jgi:site-specific DNA-methyltransferase (adenine-specific)
MISRETPVFNARQRMDGRKLLRALPEGRAALAFVDPQYRAIMDRQKYGNEGERQKARAALPQMTDEDIAAIVEEVERVLRPSGHLALWVDKYSLASAHYHRWFMRTGLTIVDLICWNKGRIGMGRRARCKSEYLVMIQKPPTRAQDVWTDRGIPDCWDEPKDLAKHPHAKPIALTTRLVEAVTRPGDLVVDPCAGGYGVLDACLLTGREFVGCDLAF